MTAACEVAVVSIASMELAVIEQPAASAEVHLLGGLAVTRRGEAVELPLAAQRLLAFLCLQERPVQRTFVAGVLWPEKPEQRATANLRSALWRLHQPGVRLVESSATHMRMESAVRIDAREAARQARRVLDGETSVETADLVDRGELLPDWYDDWVLIERERFRQLRLHALEALCLRWVAEGRFALAIDAGLAAVAADPLRETAHRALITAHLAEGNHVEAVRQLASCRAVLEDELGIAPSRALERLVNGDAAATAQ